MITVPNPNMIMHIVGVYSVSSMSLYLNGVLVASQNISIKFTNTSVSLAVGPTSSNEYFLIDAPAVYRYGLSHLAILSNYNNLFLNTDDQVAAPDLGQLFIASERYQPIDARYQYPIGAPWEPLISDNENLAHNKNNNSLYLKPGSLSGEFVEDILCMFQKFLKQAHGRNV